MRAAPAALATVFVLSGLRTVEAEPCPPRATLDGDRTAVERVTVELKRLGVSVTTASASTSADGCSIVRAQVALETGGGIAVAVHGATRGSEGRIVSDAALAAAWIDSWTRDDIDNALWAAPPPTSPSSTSSVPSMSNAANTKRGAVANADANGKRVASADVDVPPPVDAPVAASAAGAGRWDRIAVTAAFEQTWSSDDASWQGASAAACVRVGSFCVGGRVRAAFDPERLHNSTAVSRSDLSAMATASVPIALGRMSFAPELGLGVGRLATRRAEDACKAVMPDPNCNAMTDPMCEPQPGMCEPNEPAGTTMPKTYVGDSFSAATYAPRLALALRVAVPLFEHVWLDGLAGFTYSPFAHGGVFDPDPKVADIIAPELVAMPGEPSSGYVLGVGIRVGAK